MRISNKAIDLIKQFEGCSLKAYKCSANQWTIGYGHTRGVCPGDACTNDQALHFLLQDVNRFEAYINEAIVKHIDYEISQDQFDALVSFAFNIGSITDNFRMHLMMGNLSKAMERMLMYSKSNDKYILSLHHRRMLEVLLFTGYDFNTAEIRHLNHSELNELGVDLLTWYRNKLKSDN